ncbi:MAG: recombinase family protein [Clostridia bacterium]|nr:recombinase family protein [Clostridia bacterium]
MAHDNYNNLTNYNTIYNVGIYLRLSREDETAGQSMSIQNQKDYIMNYVLEQGWNICNTYIDDGYSGLNFDRPAFKNLIADIENKKIDLVITKDLSRLGRDYIDTGYYLERYFPQKNVRYIALSDGIDTFENTSNNDLSPFKSVINDMYAKDISKKIRTVMDTKRINGQFIGAFAPYGYVKDKENKNKLIIDEEAASIVRRIYEMYISGQSMANIVRTFNTEKILPPTEYKRQVQNLSYVNVCSKYGVWRLETIKRILTNPTYIGNMVQHRSEKINYKVKKFKKIPKKDWIIAENTHEPIIDKNTFETVQAMVEKKSGTFYPSQRVEHILSGIIYCGDCGMPMTFRRLKRKGINQMFCMCSGYSRFGKEKCDRNLIKEELLNNYVLTELKYITKQTIKHKEFYNELIADLPDNKFDKIQDEMERINKRLNDIKRIIKNLYEDKVKEIISEEDFLSMSSEFNQEKEDLAKRYNDLLAQKQTAELSPEKSFEILSDIIDFENVEKSIITKLIKRIDVCRNGDITINYNFKNPFIK